jgi:bromodomain-containing protein 7/9
VYYLEYGPFSSHAPIYDSSYSNLSKEESDLLMSTYGDETGYQYALSLVEFAKGTGPTFVKYVDDLLNSITNNEHQKYLEKKANNGISSPSDCEGSSSSTTTTSNNNNNNNNNERKQSSDNNPVEITVDKPLNM